MVLTHTTGLPNWRPGRWDVSPQPLALVAAPETRFGYSGEGFELLRIAVEDVVGQPAADLVAREVFAPAGISRRAVSGRRRMAWTITSSPPGTGMSTRAILYYESGQRPAPRAMQA
jgi:CubicO group peptidase (beta-lactamase class C family)